MAITNALRGITGEFEVQRILGAVGTLTYILCVPLFVVTGVITGVTVTEFCLAYPGGLSVCIGATAGAIALKDRQTAAARVVSRSGSSPVTDTSG